MNLLACVAAYGVGLLRRFKASPEGKVYVVVCGHKLGVIVGGDYALRMLFGGYVFIAGDIAYIPFALLGFVKVTYKAVHKAFVPPNLVRYVRRSVWNYYAEGG